MINIESTIFIHRPIQQVFDFVSTPENDFQWQYGTLASIRIAESIPGKGVSFKSTSNFMGHRTQSTFEVVEYETNKMYQFKSLTGPLSSLTSYSFENVNDGTQVNILIRINLITLPHLSEIIIGKTIKKQLRENLALLKNIMEIG